MADINTNGNAGGESGPKVPGSTVENPGTAAETTPAPTDAGADAGGGPSPKDAEPHPTTTTEPQSERPVPADSSRAKGALQQTIGSTKEALGELLHLENLRRAGEEQRKEGEAREEAALRRDAGSGVVDAIETKIRKVVQTMKGERKASVSDESGKRKTSVSDPPEEHTTETTDSHAASGAPNAGEPAITAPPQAPEASNEPVVATNDTTKGTEAGVGESPEKAGPPSIPVQN